MWPSKKRDLLHWCHWNWQVCQAPLGIHLSKSYGVPILLRFSEILKQDAMSISGGSMRNGRWEGWIARRFCCSFRKDFPNQSLISTAAHGFPSQTTWSLNWPFAAILEHTGTTGIEEFNNWKFENLPKNGKTSFPLNGKYVFLTQLKCIVRPRPHLHSPRTLCLALQ